MANPQRGTLHNPATGKDVEVDLRDPNGVRRAAENLVETPEQWPVRSVKGLFRSSSRADSEQDPPKAAAG